MRKTYIENFNKIFREDPYVISIVNALSIDMDSALEIAQNIYLNMFFDTMTEDLGIPLMAKTLDIQLRNDLTTEEKRSIIQAKWKSKGKCDIDLIQSVCNSWKNGEVEVDFIDDSITIHFASLAGVPSDIQYLKDALDKVKPAYLLIDFIYNFLYWDLWDSWNMTWDYVDSKNLTWDIYETTINKP